MSVHTQIHTHTCTCCSNFIHKYAYKLFRCLQYSINTYIFARNNNVAEDTKKKGNNKNAIKKPLQPSGRNENDQFTSIVVVWKKITANNLHK